MSAVLGQVIFGFASQKWIHEEEEEKSQHGIFLFLFF